MDCRFFLNRRNGRQGGGEELQITHEEVTRHLGGARDVIIRLLRYFPSEGLIALSRGGITLADPGRLTQLAAHSLRE